MLGLTQLEERLLWILIVVVVIFGFAWHERNLGAQHCEQADKQAAAAQLISLANQRAIDDRRLEEAEREYSQELAALQHARDAEPVPHLVCHETHPKPVPTPTEVPDTRSPSTEPLPAGDAASFDPSAAVLAIADEADKLLASCRELNSAVSH